MALTRIENLFPDVEKELKELAKTDPECKSVEYKALIAKRDQFKSCVSGVFVPPQFTPLVGFEEGDDVTLIATNGNNYQILSGSKGNNRYHPVAYIAPAVHEALKELDVLES